MNVKGQDNASMANDGRLALVDRLQNLYRPFVEVAVKDHKDLTQAEVNRIVSATLHNVTSLTPSAGLDNPPTDLFKDQASKLRLFVSSTVKRLVEALRQTTNSTMNPVAEVEQPAQRPPSSPDSSLARQRQTASPLSDSINLTNIAHPTTVMINENDNSSCANSAFPPVRPSNSFDSNMLHKASPDSTTSKEFVSTSNLEIRESRLASGMATSDPPKSFDPFEYQGKFGPTLASRRQPRRTAALVDYAQNDFSRSHDLRENQDTVPLNALDPQHARPTPPSGAQSNGTAKNTSNQVPGPRMLPQQIKKLLELIRVTSIAGLDPDLKQPYLSFEKRESVVKCIQGQTWSRGAIKQLDGTIVHVDFTELELKQLRRIINLHHENLDQDLDEESFQEMIADTSTQEHKNFAKIVQQNSFFPHRSEEDVLELLEDVKNRHELKTNRIYTVTFNCNARPPRPSQRLGHLDYGRAGMMRPKALALRLREEANDKYGEWRSWTGASSDILVADWASDSLRYLVGASAHTDNRNMQYNRRNNLLVGDIRQNTITELAGHRILRPRPSTIRRGPNSEDSTYNVSDPHLYTTVTAVKWAAQGDQFYTSSYDRTVKVWNSRGNEASCLATLHHDSEVETIDVSRSHLLATATRQRDGPIRIYNLNQDNIALSTYVSLTSSHMKAKSKETDVVPSCLKFSPPSDPCQYLLAGFALKDSEDSYNPGKVGDMFLWDVETQQQVHAYPNAQNVFDGTWHPGGQFFATASTPQEHYKAQKDTKSVVRVWEERTLGSIYEYECTALDMNDVAFCPFALNYIVAGCTDGSAYVWDSRMPDRVLHRLKHGDSLATPRPDFTREQSDTGVRLLLWAGTKDRLFTGSSDGVLKAWDIRRDPTEALIEDVVSLNSEIMCGAFSPDYTNFLVGDSQGTTHILSNAPLLPPHIEDDILFPEKGDGKEEPGVKSIKYIPDPEYSLNDEVVIDENGEAASHEGRDAARQLIASGQLVMHDIYGPGKGPNYQGPYAAYAHEDKSDPRNSPLLPNIQALGLHRMQRRLAGPRGVSMLTAEDERWRLEQKKIALAFSELRNKRQQRKPQEERNHKHANSIREFEDESGSSRKRIKIQTNQDDENTNSDLPSNPNLSSPSDNINGIENHAIPIRNETPKSSRFLPSTEDHQRSKTDEFGNINLKCSNSNEDINKKNSGPDLVDKTDGSEKEDKAKDDNMVINDYENPNEVSSPATGLKRNYRDVANG